MPPGAGKSLLAALCAVAALACRVELEGAACDVPGATDQCPDGQACGNDRKCSERALACAATRCTPGAVLCRGEAWWGCTAADEVCGTLAEKLADCAGQGLECGGVEGTCRCPAGGPVFAVDPVGSGAGGLAPTGAETNPACGFATLGEALAAAGSYAGSAVVRVVSPPASGSFSLAPADVPLTVPAGVTLESATPTAPGGWIIETADAVNGATEPAIVHLAAGAAIRGFTIRNQLATPAVTPSGSAVLCDDAAGTLSHLSIETNNLSWGVRLTGTCAATLDSVAVYGPRKAALSVETLSGVFPQVVGGSFTGRAPAPDPVTQPGHGVWVRSGGVAIRAPDGVAFSQLAGTFSGGAPAELSGSTGAGLRSDDYTSTAISVSLDRVRIAGNGAAGAYLSQLPAGSTVSIRSSQVEGNAGWPYEFGRTGGGVVLVSAFVPDLTFKGNRVWANAGDQVGLWLDSSTTTVVDLSGGDPVLGCADPVNQARANVFGCGSGNDVYSTTKEAPVSAVLNYWKGVPRVTAVDFSNACSWEPPLCP
ncbi:MAG TPA: right-handed parallel beta-helix repeat-containing protein [Anaeromyxobacteraceae bacterium]|nr:right-handed parallel beta-helix repeat-containing protein [Anaeromyxobacteraceae bacterium]